MRRAFCFLMILALGAAAPLYAQDGDKKDDKKEEKKDEKKKKKPIARIVEVQVGYRSNNPNDPSSRYKVGLWAPVYVTIEAGEDGLPVKGRGECFIQVETIDSEETGTTYTVRPISVEPEKTQTFVAYVKAGNIGAETKVTLNVDGRVYTAPPIANPLELHKHVYLTLGARLPDMEAALVLLNPQGGQGFGADPNRFAAYEANYNRLPELSLGYQGVDMVFLTTENKKFLDALATDKNATRLKALAQWVRHGGRLVISVNWQNQDLVSILLQNPQAWVPPVPVTIPATAGDVKKNSVKEIKCDRGLEDVHAPLSAAQGGQIYLPQLQPANFKPGDWEVRAAMDDPDNRPLIVRMPYGMGSITLLAFSLDQGVFTRWDNRVEFLSKLITNLAPRATDFVNRFDRPGRRGGIAEANDLTTEMQRELDKFDVQMVPFGWVALFIVIYIIVVGPLDYVILRFVFGKLEWTWFTFPAVVVAVSVAAYFTAYALKGNDLKVNKVDIVDFDLRTDLDAQRKPARSYAYGQTYFTILSPRVQNYTIGIEPNPAFWSGQAGKPVSADQVSWLGRPDPQEPNGMGRAGAQGLFRRPYQYAEDATGLTNVPISVWMTKSFNASWEMALDQLPVQADLFHHPRDGEVMVSGSLQNNLPVALTDAWLFYNDRCYPLEEGALAKKNEAKAINVRLGWLQGTDYRDWLSAPVGGNRAVAGRSIQNPTSSVKQLLFYDALNVAGNVPNHGQRPLDLSWRLHGDREGRRQAEKAGELREAILVARVAFRHGSLEGITADVSDPVPTKLWLGDLPSPEKTRPALQGQLYQDTFIRVLLPVRSFTSK